MATKSNYLISAELESLHKCQLPPSCHCSVAQACLVLCDFMDCSTPGFLSFTISWNLLNLMSIKSMMPSNHLILCCSLLLLLSFPLHQGLFQWVSLHISWPKFGASVSASALLMGIQGLFPWGLTGLISLLSKGLSRVFSSTKIWMHQFFIAQCYLWSNSHICTWLLEKP